MKRKQHKIIIVVNRGLIEAVYSRSSRRDMAVVVLDLDSTDEAASAKTQRAVESIRKDLRYNEIY